MGGYQHPLNSRWRKFRPVFLVACAQYPWWRQSQTCLKNWTGQLFVGDVPFALFSFCTSFFTALLNPLHDVSSLLPLTLVQGHFASPSNSYQDMQILNVISLLFSFTLLCCETHLLFLFKLFRRVKFLREPLRITGNSIIWSICSFSTSALLVFISTNLST